MADQPEEHESHLSTLRDVGEFLLAWVGFLVLGWAAANTLVWLSGLWGGGTP